MGKQLAVLDKNAREKIIISEGTFEGHDLIDVRVYYLDEKRRTEADEEGHSDQARGVP